MDAAILYPQIGTKEDSANASGSLHAKTKDIKDKVNILGTSSDNRASNTVMGWLASPIKSVQRGVITLNQLTATNSATISAVNTSKSFVNFLGQGNDYIYSGLDPWLYGSHFGRLALTNSTTVTATRDMYSERCVGTLTISYEVIEFY